MKTKEIVTVEVDLKNDTVAFKGHNETVNAKLTTDILGYIDALTFKGIITLKQVVILEAST